jgi:NADH:ubiquinone oxidoreductase subunit E
MLSGHKKVLDQLKRKIGTENAGVSKDGKYSLEEAECLCACEKAPMMQINDKYYGPLDEKKVDEILGQLK